MLASSCASYYFKGSLPREGLKIRYFMLGLAVLLLLGLRLLARLSGHAPATLPPLPRWQARLSAGKVPSRAELDSGRASLARALADVGAAVARVTAARAALSTDQINLSKASIHSRTTNCRPARRSA